MKSSGIYPQEKKTARVRNYSPTPLQINAQAYRHARGCVMMCINMLRFIDTRSAFRKFLGSYNLSYIADQLTTVYEDMAVNYTDSVEHIKQADM
jgi:hypothetical protein